MIDAQNVIELIEKEYGIKLYDYQRKIMTAILSDQQIIPYRNMGRTMCMEWMKVYKELMDNEQEGIIL